MLTEYSIELSEENLPVMVKERTYDFSAGSLTEPADMEKIFKQCFRLDRKAEEIVAMVSLNTKLQPICLFEVSHGIIDASLLSPREVFQRALLSGAHSIVLAHNHPSGNCAPSENDKLIAEKLLQAAALFQMQLVDFLIIAKNDYYSFRESEVGFSADSGKKRIL